MAMGFISLLMGQDIPTEGLIAHYTFDNDGDTTVVDASGNGADGVFVGFPEWGDGVSGKAIYLDGVESYVDLGTQDGLFDITEQITLATWVLQLDAANGEHNPWVGKGDHAWAIKHRLDPYYEFFIYNGDWVTCRTTDADEIMSHNDEWHHFAGTYDGVMLTLYIDGEWRAETEHIGSIDLSEHTVNLGRNSEATDRLFNGYLDEVFIYDIALDETQILALYNAPFSDVVENNTRPPAEYYLKQNYPNPFNPSTQISYSLPRTAEVHLEVFDVRGQKVRALINGVQLQGPHSVSFEAKDLPSGIYFYRLQVGDALNETKKMMLVK